MTTQKRKPIFNLDVISDNMYTLEKQSNVVHRNFSIKEVYEMFLDDMKKRGLSESTIKAQYYIMISFGKFMDLNSPIEYITEDSIIDYINNMNERGNSKRTQHTNCKALRTFLYWAMKEGFLEEFRVTVPKAATVKLDAYTKEEIQKLLVEPNLKEIRFSQYVAYVAINFFVYTGCRVGTLVNVLIEDIDFGAKIIRFRHTKNGKEHLIPLSSNLSIVLKKYMKIRIQAVNNGDIGGLALFCNAYGEKLNSGKIYKYIMEFNRSRGIERTSLHSFRRFYVKSLVVQGVPIPKIQYLVQHSRADLVSHYCKLYSKDLIDDVEAFSNNIVPKVNERRKKMKI